ncbi:MAG: adenine phosphoribosyltransferase [Planctomycetes bacterium]|nr:adenine phosphoribosyltransferase [Planctomycetota bacterium]
MTDLNAFIRDVPDFPKPGIVFKDITPLLGNAGAFRAAIDGLQESLDGVACDAIVGMESRGFLFGAALAMQMGVGFVPARKPGKLPARVVTEEYALEYGTDKIQMHEDGVRAGQDVVVVDDLIATGGTALATCRLIERLGARVSALGFVIALDFLPWRDKLGDREVRALLRYA